MTTPFGALELDTRWTERSGTEGDVRLRFDQEGTPIEFSARRCADGRLRNAYPVSAHDVELDVLNGAAPQQIVRALAVLTQAILSSDHSCRRVVFRCGRRRPRPGCRRTGCGLSIRARCRCAGSRIELACRGAEMGHRFRQ